MKADGNAWFDKMESALEVKPVWEGALDHEFHNTYRQQIAHAMRECDAGDYEGCCKVDFHFYWRGPIMLFGSKKSVMINPGYVYPYGDSFEFIVMKVIDVHTGPFDLMEGISG